MAILDQLFGLQPQNQDTGGLVQSILSQRFQPSVDDAAQATLQTATTGGRFVNPSEVMAQRIAPAMQVAGTVGNLNMTQLALQKMQEEMLRDRIMWGMEIGKLPAGAFPGPYGGGQMPPVGFNQQQPMTETQTNDMAQLYPPEALNGGMASPKGGEVPLTAPGGQAFTPPNVAAQPITTGFGMPVPVEGSPGQQWSKDASGRMVATQIPGAPPKMENGMAVTTDPQTGQPQQQVPYNPQARVNFEKQLQEMKNLYDQLHQSGGSVEVGAGNIGTNLRSSLSGSNFTLPEWAGGGSVGGQNISRVAGSDSQAIRDQINNLSKQMMLPYMQAVGATPGMERAYQAQLMMLQALGSNPTQSRQAVQKTLADLSNQAGTGSLSKQMSGEQQPEAGQSQQSGRVAIITPDGKPGTIDAAHVQDLIAAGGKLAQ